MTLDMLQTNLSRGILTPQQLDKGTRAARPQAAGVEGTSPALYTEPVSTGIS